MNNSLNYKCVNGHDRCDQMYAGPECPYCELDTSETEQEHDPDCRCELCRYWGN